MSNRNDRVEIEIEEHSSGGSITSCGHCDGRGVTQGQVCCMAEYNANFAMWVRCCVCGGKGKVRV